MKFDPNLEFQNWNGTENIHALLNAFISSICGGFAAMILLIQLAQVLVSTFTFATPKKFREILTWLFLFPVWSIFRGTVRNQGILRDFRHYPSGFSWFHRSDFVQRIQTYH